MSSNPDMNEQRKIQQREAIQRKEKLQEVVSGLQEGKIPDNADITQSIDNVTKSGAFQQPGMSATGQKVMADTEKVLDTTKRVFEEKNANNELQSALFYGTKAMTGAGGTAASELKNRKGVRHNLRAGGESTVELAQEATRRAWNVTRLIITSREFRRLINDLQQVLQDAIRAGVSGDPEHKARVGTNIGTEEESSPREALSAVGSTGREHVSNVYTSATSAAQPVIDSFSAGEMGVKDAGKELGRTAVRGVRSTVEGIDLSDEQRDILVGRFKTLLIEAHSSDEFQSALDDLLDICRTIAEHTGQVGQHVNEAAGTATNKHDQDFQIAQRSAKQLIEKFANGKSLDPLINAIATMGNDMRNDEQLRSLFDEMNEFIHRSLRDTQYLQEVDWTNEANSLLSRGRHTLTENYRGHTDAIFDEGRAFITALQRDQITNELANDLERLTSDLFLDENGNPTIKYEVVKDFAKLVPVIASKLEYLALPKVDYSDEEFDYILDNVVLRCTNIVPRYLYIRTDTDVHIKPPGDGDRVQEHVTTDEAGVSMHNRVHISLSHIRAHAMDMAFYYNKKTGIPKMMDVGYADITIPDKGLEINLTLVQADDKDNANLVKVEKAKATIHEMKLKVHDSKHDFLYKLLGPFINKAVKRQAEKGIADQLTKIVIQLDQQVGRLSQQASQMRQQAGDQIAGAAYNTAQNVQNNVSDVQAKVRMNRPEQRVAKEE